MSNYKHLTFFNLAERLQDYRRCYYLSGNSPTGHEISTRKMDCARTVTTDICPGVTVHYDTADPVQMRIAMLHRGQLLQVGLIAPLKDGRTNVVYYTPTVTRHTKHGDRLVLLNRWVRGMDVEVPKKYATTLPRFREGGVKSMSRQVTATLCRDGDVEEWREGLLDQDSRAYFCVGHLSIAARVAMSNPLFSCWSWWHPGKLALAAAESLKRETATIGRFWIKPHIVMREGGRGPSKTWHGCVGVVAPTGDTRLLSIGPRDSVGKVNDQKQDILAWAMNQIEIPGPMF
jgi:hypothetical protein